MKELKSFNSKIEQKLKEDIDNDHEELRTLIKTKN